MDAKQTIDIIPLIDKFGNKIPIENLAEEINAFIDQVAINPDDFVNREVRALTTVVVSATLGRMMRQEDVNVLLAGSLFPVIVRAGMCSFLIYKAMQDRGLEVKLVEAEVKDMVAVTSEQIEEILGNEDGEEDE